MGTVRRVGEDYYIEFEARGLKYQQKAGRDEQAAWRLLTEVEGKIRQGEMGILVRDVEYPIFFKDFLDQLIDEHSLPTRKRYDAALKHFQDYLKGRKTGMEKLSQITPKVLEDYRHDLYQSAETRWGSHTSLLVNLTIVLLRDVFDYAIKTGFLNDNPLLHIRLMPGLEKKTLPSAADLDMLMHILTESKEDLSGLKTTALFTVFTGLRAVELCALQWQDIDWQKPSMQVASPSQKEMSALLRRVIPLESYALDILQRRKNGAAHSSRVFGQDNGDPWTPFLLQQGWNRLLQRDETLRRHTFHCLRHAFAYRLLVRHIPLSRLYRLMGYQDILRMTPYMCYLPQQLPGGLF
jgi:site-specific recombinase XerD